MQVIPLSKDQRMLDLFHSSEIFIYEGDEIGGFVGIKENSIVWLFVHPNCRGQTIGKELILYVLRKLKGQVTLTVVGSNEVAVRLYKSIGFSILQESIGNYQSHAVIVYKMGIQLRDG
ncbi:GNAT family N-acetyltransferase [Marinimicrobium locisalis]|uniref:GNAT family N-acetyltransferase n=1 Tax=Marinimicrobium locisalis TaxID=546022 RepID=UPI003221800B